MTGHARLGPSDSGRWLNCSGSVNFTANYPKQKNQFYSAEGTVAHTIRENCLRFGLDPYDFIGTKHIEDGFEIVVDEAMCEHLQPGIDEILEYEGALYVEEQVDTTPWTGLDPDGNRQFGTIDAGIVGKKLIVLSDLKYGMGVAVEAVKNTQQMIYALAFWKQFARHITDATDFLIIIDQPRNSAGGGYWRVTLEELKKFGEYVRERAALTLDPNAPLTPGEKQCSWCDAANVPGRHGGCPAHHEWMADQIDMKFDDVDDCVDLDVEWKPPLISSLTPERRGHIVRVRKSIERWLEKLHADTIADALANRPTPGHKVVEGRHPPRKWRDDATAEAWLEQRIDVDKIFNRKLISPSQGEKILGKGHPLPRALVEHGQAKPTLVPIEDARKPLKTVDEKFDSHTDDMDI